MKKKALIIGSGPTGIGGALGLENDCLVLEASNNVGGFSTSMNINGAVFDYGGHSFHTPHPEIKDLVFSTLDMYEQKREARCLVNGELIPYPFQKHYEKISDKEIVDECKEGMQFSDDGVEASNFEEYIVRRFGPGISKHFMLPYNRKLWGRDLRRMASDWTSQRVAAPSGVIEKFDTEGGKRKPLQADTKVAYPAKGGFGEIWHALGKKIQNIELMKKIVSIDYKRKRLYTQDRIEYQYEKLLSSIPLNRLLQIIDGVPGDLLTKASRLDVLSLKLGLIVINHPVDTEIQRIYSAEEHIPAHKTAINHNSSDYLRSLPKHGIMMEISEGPQKKLPNKEMKPWIMDSLIKMGLIKSHYEVDQIEIVSAKYAYPVPSHEKEDVVNEIQNWLNEVGIYSAGRFGQWAYINSDESLYRGIELGKRLAGN